MSTLYVQHRYLSSKDSEKIVITQAAIIDIVFIKMVVFRLLLNGRDWSELFIWHGDRRKAF